LQHPPSSATRSHPNLSIVVPIYNEEESLEELYWRLTKVLGEGGRSYEIILVDDGSRDSSASILEGLARRDPSCKAVILKRNFGQTAALMAGIDQARGEIIVSIDADLQNDPGDIPRLLEKLEEGYDVCSGWRRDRKDARLTKVLPSRIANRLISLVSGVELRDYGCTLKAYRQEVLKGVRLYGEMHRFIPIYASWMGARVTELAVNHFPRRHGQSNYGLERIFKVLLDLIVIKFLSSYSQRPIHLFGGFGILSLFSGLLSFGYMLWLKLFQGVSFIQTPLPTLSIFFLLSGILFISIGLLAELLTRTYHESRGTPTYMIKGIIDFSEHPPEG